MGITNAGKGAQVPGRGCAFSGHMCMAVSRFLAKRTRIGVRRARPSPREPPLRAPPCATAGGYMREKKEKKEKKEKAAAAAAAGSGALQRVGPAAGGFRPCISAPSGPTAAKT